MVAETMNRQNCERMVVNDGRAKIGPRVVRPERIFLHISQPRDARHSGCSNLTAKP
jgi:hypothetical protein